MDQGKDQVQMQEGTVPYHVPSIDTPCSTYYKIIGDLQTGQPPLIVLHGGPGSGHEYLLTFTEVRRRYEIPLIFYDQIGCASSTHLQQKAGDKSFWSVDLFVNELENLVQYFGLGNDNRPGYYIIGHSWGGVVAASYASRQPRGLRRLILASTPAIPDQFPDLLRRRWKELPQDAQRVMEEATRTGDFKSQAFADSYTSLRKRFWSRAEPYPAKELEVVFKHHGDDNTVSEMMYGPSMLECIGALKGWKLIPALPQIEVPTLVYIGEFDIVSEGAIIPFLDNIPDARKAIIGNGSHTAHVDNEQTQKKVIELVSGFLLEDRVL